MLFILPGTQTLNRSSKHPYQQIPHAGSGDWRRNSICLRPRNLKQQVLPTQSLSLFAFPKCFFFFFHQVFYRLSEPLALRSTSPCHQGYSLSIKVSTKYVVLPKHLLKQTDIFKLLGMGLLGCCWVKMSICSSLQLHLKFFL